MPQIPNARPNPDWNRLQARLQPLYNMQLLLQKRIFCVAIRGLFSNTIGAPGNDINHYDDALYIVRPQPTGPPLVSSFNFNTDPTRYGWNPGANKFMARLKPGRYTFRKRMHGGRYWAWGQDGSPVTVERIDSSGKVQLTETGSFGIDLHPGGNTTTSSEGCVTFPRSQEAEITKILNTTAKSEWFDFILLDA